MPLTSRPSLLLHLRSARPSRPRARRLRACAPGLAVAVVALPATAAALPTLPRPLASVGGSAPPAISVAGGAPLASASRGCAYTHLMPTPAHMSLVAQAIACLVNARRREAGLPPLWPHAALYQSAEGHSLSMVSSDYFSHTSPSGRTPEQRMRAAGYACRRSCGENIAWGSGSYGTASAIVSMWMSSAPHRANILRRSFHFDGIGAVVGAPARGWRHRGATTVTEDFGAAG